MWFRTAKSPEQSRVELGALDFSCESPGLWVDLSDVRAGDLAGQWAAYDLEENRRLIGRAYGKTDFLRGTPKEALDRLAAHPGRATCLPPGE